MTAALLELDGVSKHFAGVRAVDELSFGVREAEIVGLIGPNGAGKTTTLNLLTGFAAPDRGRITFGGEAMSGRRPHEVARRGMCRTFQVARPFRDMTVLENAMVGALSRTNDVGAAADGARTVLARAGLEMRAAMRAGDLTTIDQRRLEVARALATGPRLLLLDETMAGLNPAEVAVALALLRRLREDGLTLVVIEHNVRAITELCDRVIVLDHGQKISEGPPDAVIRDPAVIAAYLGPDADA